MHPLVPASSAPAVTLDRAPLRTRVLVTRMGGDRGFRRRLMELGLLPGTEVEVLRVAPLGDPVELSVRGCLLSIRRSEASEVQVASAVPGVARAEQRAPGGVGCARRAS